MEDEKSPEYKNILIDINIIVGYLDVLWNPLKIKKILSYLAHNDLLKDKVRKDIDLSVERNSELNLVNIPSFNNLQSFNFLKCSEFKYIYIKCSTFLKKINIILIQPIQNFYFFELNIKEGNIIADMYVDHMNLYGNLDEFDLKDCSNYPYTIQNQDEFNAFNIKNILSTSQNNSLGFEYISRYKICPEYNEDENITSECYLTIKNLTINYYQENFLRFFNYLISEFLGSLSASQEILEYRNLKLNLNSLKKKDKNIEFMKLLVKIENSKFILKPRQGFSEFFLMDLKNFLISCSYYEESGKIRNNPTESRWISVYKLEMQEFSIRTNKDFFLCQPTNLIINMHIPFLSEEDYKKTDLEVNKAYRFDIIIEPIKINLRQEDFKNIMMLNDLNISYYDGYDVQYDYLKYYKELNEKEKQNLIAKKKFSSNFMDSKNFNKANNLKNFSNESEIYEEAVDEINFKIISEKKSEENSFNSKNENDKTNNSEKLKKKFSDLDLNLLIEKIDIGLFIPKNNSLEKKNFKFTGLILDKLFMKFSRRLNSNKKILIFLNEISILEYNSNLKNEMSSIQLIFNNKHNNLLRKNTTLSKNENLNSLNININYSNEDKLNNYSILDTNGNNYSNSEQDKKNNFNSKKKNSLSFFNNKKISKIKFEEEYEKLKLNLLNLQPDKYEKLNFIEGELFLKIIIDKDREKIYRIELNSLKILLKIDTFLLIKQFFSEGFPFYAVNDPDLPNLYEDNEENWPGMDVKIYIKNPMLCILTDTIDNLEQDLICLTSDLIVEIKYNKISKIKNYLLENFDEIKAKEELLRNKKTENEKNQSKNQSDQEDIIKTLDKTAFIYYLDVKLLKVCPFIIKLSEFLFYQFHFKNERKIIDDFNLSYLSETFLNIDNSKKFYVMTNLSQILINDSNIILKASYRDIVLFIKAYEYNMELIGKSYEEKFDSLKYYSLQKNNNESKKELTRRKTTIINYDKCVKAVNKNIADFSEIYEDTEEHENSEEFYQNNLENYESYLEENARINKVVKKNNDFFSNKDLNLNVTSNNEKKIDLTSEFKSNFDKSSQFTNIKIELNKKDKQKLMRKKKIVNTIKQLNLDVDEDMFLEFIKENKIIENQGKEQNNSLYKKSEILKFENDNNIEEIKMEKDKKEKVDVSKMIITNMNSFISKITIKKIEIILIDDHANLYYPFLYMKIKNLMSYNSSLEFNKTNNIIIFEFNLRSNNYLANIWEPLIEKTDIEIDIISSKNLNESTMNENSVVNVLFNKNDMHKLNLNISDLTVRNFLNYFFRFVFFIK